MSNDYFAKTGNPQANSAGSSSLIRAEIASIEAGFDKLPTITANGGKIIAVNAGATALEAVTTTGTGSAVRATSPTLVTPALGTPSALVGTNITGTAAGLTAGNVTTNANLTGHVTSVGNAAVLGSFTSAQLATALTDETGSGAAVFATSPTLVTPALGTPSALVGTNITGTAAGLTAGNVTTNANLTGHVTSVGNAAVLGSFTAAQLNTAVSDADVVTIAGTETLTNKTLTTPVLTNPSYSGTTANGGTVTTIDINGGTIDGTVIGGSSAAAGSFTTVTVSSSVKSTQFLDPTGVTGAIISATDQNLYVGGVIKATLTPTGLNNTTIGATTPAAGSFTTGLFSGGVNFNASQGFLCNNAVGTYSTWQYNGTSVGDVGTSNQVFGGGSASDFALTARAGGSLQLGANGGNYATLSTTGLSVTGALSATGALTTTGGTNVDYDWLTVNSAVSVGNKKAITWKDESSNVLGRMYLTFDGGSASFKWGSLYSGGVNSTDRMTLDADGNFLVGNNSFTLANLSCFMVGKSAGETYTQHASGSASGIPYASFAYNAGVIGSITQSGTTAVAYNTTSDHRLKTNVRPANAARFADIEFVDFEWTDGRHDCGVIADQLQSVYPDLVLGEKDATETRTVEITPAVPAVLDEEGNEVTPAIPAVTDEQTFPVYQQVNYQGLIARMGTRVQKLMEQVATLEADKAMLLAVLASVDNRLMALEAA